MNKKKEDIIVELLTDLLSKVDSGLNPKSEQISYTFEEARDFLLEHRWSLLKDTRNFLNKWKHISKYFGEKSDISELTNDDILGFILYLRKLQIKNKAGKVIKDGLAPKTINHYISNLKTSIEFLEKHKKLKCINSISFSGLNLPNNFKERVCFTKDEEKTMLNYFENRYKETGIYNDLEMLHWFIINSSLGLRPAEFFALELGDIDFEKGRVTISKAEHGSTKNNLVRTLPLSKTDIDSFYILCFNRLQIEGKISVSSLMDKETLLEVILAHENKRIKLIAMSPEMLSNRWKRMRKTVGWLDKEKYKDYVPYGLRHTVASRLAGSKKFNAHQLMKYMGWKNITTSLYYVHLNIDDLTEGIGTGVDLFDD